MTTPDSSRSNGDQDGFVLVVVLGLLLIASTIAAMLMLASRSQIRVEAALNTRTELESLADGLVRLTAFRLTLQQDPNTTVDDRQPVDGTTRRCKIENEIADIRVNDVAGLVDLNSTSSDILQMLLQGVGLPDADAASLAAAIQDFRDPDNVAGDKGAEIAEYQAAGRSFGPKNALFETVDELDQVLGMTPELLLKLRPFVTVYSRSAILDLSAAPLSLLQVLARGSESDLARGSIRVPTTREEFTPSPALLTRFNPRSMSRVRSRIFAIQVSVLRPGRGRYDRHAVVELTTQAKAGFVVREWSSAPHVPVSTDGAVEADGPCIIPLG
jgi:general secretion pathway protein K